VGAPARSTLAADVFADEHAVLVAAADERRVEHAVEVVVSAHLALRRGGGSRIAPRVEDVAVGIEDIGRVGGLSRRDVEPVFSVYARVGVVVGVADGLSGVDMHPVDGRKVALHVVDRTVLRTCEDRAVGGHDGLVDGVGIRGFRQQRGFRRVRRQVDRADVTACGPEIGQRLVVADGESGDVAHLAPPWRSVRRFRC